MTDPIYGDEIAAQEKEAKKTLDIRGELHQALSALMDNPDGRSLLCWFIEHTEYFKISRANNADIYRHEGKRELGAALIELLLEVRPEALPVLKQHAQEHFNG